MVNFRWLSMVALLGASHQALAQVPVGAGGQIQQVPTRLPPQNPVPVLPIPQNQAATIANSGGITFAVTSLQITGQTRYSQSELIKAAGFQAGQNVTLRDLQLMAARITNYYNQHGYFVARAYALHPVG